MIEQITNQGDCLKTQSFQLQNCNLTDYETLMQALNKFKSLIQTIFNSDQSAILSKQQHSLVRKLQKILSKSIARLSLEKMIYLNKLIKNLMNQQKKIDKETLNLLQQLTQISSVASIQDVKSTQINNDDINNFLGNLINQKNQVNTLISCLGCIQYIESEKLYDFQFSNQNYLLLTLKSFQDDIVFTQSLCALLNSSNSFAFIGTSFIEENKKIKIVGFDIQSNLKQVCQIKIKQCLNYLVPNDLRPQVLIQKIPIIKQNKSQKTQQQYILRLSLTTNNFKSFYFQAFKDSNSQKKLEVCSCSIQKGKLKQIDAENYYHQILKKYRKNYHETYPHHGIKCKEIKQRIIKIQDIKKQIQSKNYEKQSQSSSKLKYSTIISIYDLKKQNLIQKIKSTFANNKIVYELQKINFEKIYPNLKRKYLFWQLRHSCPHETSKALLQSINKEGYLNFSRPSKNIVIRDQHFLEEKYVQFKKFLQHIQVDQSQYSMCNSTKGLIKQSINPIKLYNQSLQRSIHCYCWMATEDIRRIQFQK